MTDATDLSLSFEAKLARMVARDRSGAATTEFQTVVAGRIVACRDDHSSADTRITGSEITKLGRTDPHIKDCYPNSRE